MSINEGLIDLASTTSPNAPRVTVKSSGATACSDYTLAKTWLRLRDGNNPFPAIASDALGGSAARVDPLAALRSE